MIAWSIGAGSLAHAVHYAVLGVGVVGLLALLGPQLVPGGHRTRTVHDDHDRRVQALAHQLQGQLGGPVAVRFAAPVARAGVRASFRAGLLLPVAVVSSAAAAGVHAAAGPAHFREQLLFGLFFAGSSVAQIAWSVAVVVRPTRWLLQGAVLGNVAVLLLWLTTRTVGLPVLLPRPEAVGLWDLCCGAWELAVVLACLRMLRGPGSSVATLPTWDRWWPAARAWTAGSVLLLGSLIVLGGGS